MANKRIVLDANILIRAVLGVKVRQLLVRYANSVDFHVPTEALADAEKYLPGILLKRGLSQEDAEIGLDAVKLLVEEVPSEMTLPLRADALKRIGRRDPDDWPIVAAALALQCPIWTEDQDFFGSGIATWTSDVVEIYFDDDETPG